MKSKSIIYVLLGIGLIGLALSFEKIQQNIPLIRDIPSSFILIPSIAIFVVGMIILISTNKGKSKQTEKEVPIYKGKEIIGYRVKE